MGRLDGIGRYYGLKYSGTGLGQQELIPARVRHLRLEAFATDLRKRKESPRHPRAKLTKQSAIQTWNLLPDVALLTSNGATFQTQGEGKVKQAYHPYHALTTLTTQRRLIEPSEWRRRGNG